MVCTHVVRGFIAKLNHHSVKCSFYVAPLLSESNNFLKLDAQLQRKDREALFEIPLAVSFNGLTGKLGMFVIISVDHEIVTFITKSEISATFPLIHTLSLDRL